MVQWKLEDTKRGMRLEAPNLPARIGVKCPFSDKRRTGRSPKCSRKLQVIGEENETVAALC